MLALILPSILAGIVTHAFFLRQRDWSWQAPYILVICVELLAVVYGTTLVYGLKNPLLLTLRTSANYLLGLLVSVVSYRLFWHPLTSFPGPQWAATSRLWQLSWTGETRSYAMFENLKADFGSIVRTGPNELTVLCPRTSSMLLSNNFEPLIDEWYNTLHPNTLKTNVHDASTRHRIQETWRRSCNMQSDQSQIRTAKLCAERLLTVVSKLGGNPVDTAALTKRLSFDLVADFVFGESNQDAAEEAWFKATESLRRGAIVLRRWIVVPWLVRLATVFWQFGRLREFIINVDWTRTCVQQRLDTLELSEVFDGYIAGTPTANAELRVQCSTDAVAKLVAGSNTIGPTISNLLYLLALNPHHIDIVRQELTRDENALSNVHIPRDQSYLHACILEAVRLFPLVEQSRIQISSNSIEIEQVEFPANTIVRCPHKLLNRSPSAFIAPNEFHPERWFKQPNLNICHSVYSPFGQGSRECPGKEFALTTLHTVIAMIISDFDCELTNSSRSTKTVPWNIPSGPNMTFRKRDKH